MSATPTFDQPLGAFLEQLASRQPTPGGGAAAAVCLAQAAALGSMVLRYTLGKEKFAQHEARNSAALHALDTARAESLALADADVAAYATLDPFLRLTAAERAVAPGFSVAVETALAAPAAIGDLASGVADILRALDSTTTRLLRSDLVCAAELARAATLCAAANVRANLPLLSEESQRVRWEAWICARCEEARRCASAVELGRRS